MSKMATIAEYIEKNMQVVRTLVKNGKMPPTVLRDFKIYTLYKSLHNIPSKMDRYQFTSDSLQSNTGTVIKAVREMERKVSA